MAKKNIIDLNLAPEKYIISLEKKHFERSYGIYILEMIHGNEKLYYIECLNDSLSLSNKLPIKKLSQHLEDSVSARNNKLFKFILNNIIEIGKNPNRIITDKHKSQIEDYLIESQIKMHVYPLIRFNFEEATKKTHKENSQKVKNFEKQVIRMFIRADKKLINDEIKDEYVRYDEISFPKIWEQIKIDFYV
jgi:signal recognition particle GTPase